MKKIKIADAPNRAIDWLVAKAEGFSVLMFKDRHSSGAMNFTTDPAQAWPIIEREKISVDWAWMPDDQGYWIAEDDDLHKANGPTGLDAAMRCYCVSVYGEEAEVPEELLS